MAMAGLASEIAHGEIRGKDIIKAVDEQQFYLLLKDHHGLKLVKSFRTQSYTSTTKRFAFIVKGEVLTKLPEKDQPEDKTLISLTTFERPYIVECPRTDILELDKESAELLLPICSMGARLKILEERDKLKSGKRIKIDSLVWVKVTVNRVEREFKGVVKYKGPLPGYKGTMFGVEVVVGLNRAFCDRDFCKLDLIYHKQESMFNKDIQTPRHLLKTETKPGYSVETRFLVYDNIIASEMKIA